MKRALLNITALLVFLVFSCQKEQDSPDSSATGDEVNFSFVVDDLTTKTTYTGERKDGLSILAWSENDEVRLWSSLNPAEESDYRYVTDSHWYADNPMFWDGDAGRVFYGTYPIYGISHAGNSVTADMPNVQRPDDMSHAYMTAVKAVSSPAPSVQVHFSMFASAFTLIFDNMDETEELSLSDITITADKPLSGLYRASLENDGTRSFAPGDLPVSGASNTVTIDLEDMHGLYEVGAWERRELTFFALPQDYASLRLNCTVHAGGEQKQTQITLTPSFGTVFEAGKRHCISIRLYDKDLYFDGGEYGVIVETPSFEYSGGTAPLKVFSSRRVGDSYEAVKWKVQVFSGDRTNISDFNDDSKWTTPPSSATSSTTYGWLGVSKTQGSGSASFADPDELTLSASTVSVTIPSSPESFHKERMKWRVHASGIFNLVSKENAVDLSLYDVFGRLLPLGRSTANCYVVSAPGWYKFPAVFGNSFKNRMVNLPDEVSDSNANLIVQPWIEDIAEAVLLWQDRYGVISWNTSGEEFKPRLVTENGHPYVYFYIPPDKIEPCNAVMAVRNSSGQILWSWHIWVSNHRIEANSNGYMSVNIGWRDITASPGDYAPARGEVLRIVQTDDSGIHQPGMQIRYFTVSQFPSSELKGKNLAQGSNTYYQTARKDPFYSVKASSFPKYETVWDGNENVIIPASDQSWYMHQMPSRKTDLIGGNLSSSGFSHHLGIRYPFQMSSGYVVGYGGSGEAFVWWEHCDYKTITDPSPTGFMVGDMSKLMALYSDDYVYMNGGSRYETKGHFRDGEFEKLENGYYVGTGPEDLIYLPFTGIYNNHLPSYVMASQYGQGAFYLEMNRLTKLGAVSLEVDPSHSGGLHFWNYQSSAHADYAIQCTSILPEVER